MKFFWIYKVNSLYLSYYFEAIHNKDYSVVKTLGSLVLNGGFFIVTQKRQNLKGEIAAFNIITIMVRAYAF